LRTNSNPRVDCEFSLALNNRTGKYFFCRDMLEASSDLIGSVHYWRLPFRRIPSRTLSRVLGRLARIEVDFRVKHPDSYRYLPPIVRQRPTLFTDPRECVLYRLKANDLVLCHDLGPITHPELYAPGVHQIYAAAFDRIKQTRPLLLFVSEATKTDFIRLYGSDYPLLRVVHPPLRSGLDEIEEQSMPGLSSKYFLTVGSVGTRKNQARAIEAFKLSGLAEKGFSYVICGGPEPGWTEVEAAAKATKGVVLSGYVNDRQLQWLYNHAAGFILPSIFEGFGLPAAEAIKHGLIPLVGAGGALHEVTGDAAILVDPFDTSGIANGMQNLANMSPDERKRRILDLTSNIEKFSLEAAIAAWRASIEQAVANDISVQPKQAGR
jgi:glycosyltransferase involved in cell wall biosynthesis